MSVSQPPSNRAPSFIRDMFQESLDFMLHDNWLDCLDEVGREQHLVGEASSQMEAHQQRGTRQLAAWQAVE